MRPRTPILLVMILALVATACGDGEDVAQTPSPPAVDETSPPSSPEPTGPVEGGRLVAAISQDPGQLNPAITTSGGTHTASELMYNGLIRLDEDLEPEPELAESWDIEEDGAVYRFNLRDDVTWHDGEPFTSADVKFTFEEALLQFHSRTKASMGEAIESIETPDDHTVVFTFSEPYSPMMQQLDVTEAPIIAQHVYEGVDNIEEAEANQNPVGTGPFTFVSYTRDSEVRYARNDNYFKEDLPYLDEVVQQIIPEEQNQLIALESGDVDWIWGVPGPNLADLRGNQDFNLIETTRFPGGANCIMTLSYNLDRPILQDQGVRRAIALGLDRQAHLDSIEFGEGQIARAPISSGMPFAHHADLENFPGEDTAQAEDLLEEAGWVEPEGGGTRVAQGVEGVEDGTELSLSYLSFTTFRDYPALARQQLSEIGVDIVEEPLERGTFISRVFTDRNFDLNVISYCNGTDPQIGVRRMYISSNIGDIPFSNASAYRSDEVDRLFDEALRTVPLEERSQIYRQISENLVEDLPYYWLTESTSTRAHTADCEGFLPYYQFAEAAFCQR